MARELKITEGAAKALDMILKLFESPEDLPAKMARVFLNIGQRYCDRWSVRNQFIVAIMGASDAATAKTWQSRGRWVTKERYYNGGFNILKPLVRCFKVKELDDEGKEVERTVRYLYGFEHWHVYAKEETVVKDAELAAKFDATQEASQYLSALPWLDLSKAWGIEVHPAASSWFLGSYDPTTHAIQLCVENVAVWAHELVHAAEDRLGHLKVHGQDPEQEIVAELGAQVLLTCAGLSAHVDLGGCWEYLKHYSAGRDAKMEAYRLTGRILDAVSLILTESGQQVEVSNAHDAAAA